MELKFIQVSEFFKGSQRTDIQERVKREMYIAMLRGTYSDDYIEKVFHVSRRELLQVEPSENTARRQGEDWSSLAHQIVGGEYNSN